MARAKTSRSPAGAIVGMSVALIILATIGITAMQLLFNATTTGIDASVVTLITTVVGIVFAVGIVVLFLKYAGIEM